MALYHDAVSVLTSADGHGSFKSRIYGTSSARSNPSQIYALVSETAKRDTFLKEVIDNAQLLRNEPKSGICTPPKHPLRQIIDRNKARLNSEFIRARLRRKCTSFGALEVLLEQEAKTQLQVRPRWARLNPLTTEHLSKPGHGELAYTQQFSLSNILHGTDDAPSFCEDTHIPNLFAFSPHIDLTKSASYRQGGLILQDKASCFPAYLLLGDERNTDIGDVVDGCAAPGNKTTHLASILHQKVCTGKLFACERDKSRSATLISMIAKAGASDRVTILANQDFLSLDVEDVRFNNVTHLLLDPSCSGSGILGRDDVPKLALPADPRGHAFSNLKNSISDSTKPRKRKRADDAEKEIRRLDVEPKIVDDDEETPTTASEERLQKLSSIQTRIVEHAMSFPAARRITYSTCSIYEEENEVVVSRLLNSQIAQNMGWTLLARPQQVKGMRAWNKRGVRSHDNSENLLDQEQLEACIRCQPHDEEGTMGFFVCAFVRVPNQHAVQSNRKIAQLNESAKAAENENDDENEIDAQDGIWEGFD